MSRSAASLKMAITYNYKKILRIILNLRNDCLNLYVKYFDYGYQINIEYRQKCD